MVKRIQSAVAQLQAFPESGRIVPEYGLNELREVIVPPYRVVYRYLPERDLVQVVAVMHGRRLLPSFEEQ